VEHADAAQFAALVGALGAVLVLLPRGRVAPLAGFGLLGLATALIGWSLVGDDDVRLLFTDPAGIALVVVGAAAALVLAVPLTRYPAVVPVALLAVAPFRLPVQVGDQDAFLLLPLYLVLASAVLAFAYRAARGRRPPSPPWLLALPLAVFVAYVAASFLWTYDEREGGIELAFFVFPFVAGVGVVARAPLASWLGKALAATLVSLGLLFAAVGLWQAHTRTLFFARDVEVANAYTSFFRVTSLFKDPSLYGRYLVIPIAVLLVILWLRRARSLEWVPVGLLIAFLFAGLYFSYSQSSFVALFCVAFAIAFLAAGRRLRIFLLVCAAAAALGAAAFAAQAVQGRSLKDVTSSRSRLVTITLDAFELKPVAGVGVGGQPQASGEAIGTKKAKRNASHTTPLTVLSEFGIVGFALYLWLLAAVVLALLVVTRRERALGYGLAAVLLVLFVHSLLYAGFFEDPITWGVFALSAAVVASVPAAERVSPLAAIGIPASWALWRDGRMERPSMLRSSKWLLAGAGALLLLLLAGAGAAFWLAKGDRPQGALDTNLSDVTVTVAKKPPKKKPAQAKPDKPAGDEQCWLVFGGDAQRSLARPGDRLGLPVRKPLWSRVLDDYAEFPPAYCDGMLYINTLRGHTYAIVAATGKVRWKREIRGPKPSSPAIDGPRLIVSSKDGTVTALDRESGRLLWQIRTGSGVESSPVVVDGLVYFGAHDGRVFAVRSRNGSVRWAYDTGGRVNASPSIYGRRLCVTTYAGGVFCLDRRTGRKLWSTYVKRDAFRYDSFYSSPSTDGKRLYTISRSGKIVALDARNGRILWTETIGGWGYATPAVTPGRVFIGGFDGNLRAFRPATGHELWRTYLGGKILGSPVVVGKLVFVTTIDRNTYALRVENGKVVWRLKMGKYTPVIATERTYYFSLNGRLIAFRGRHAAPSARSESARADSDRAKNP
jgi:outer membrane protein assembly factor BamB/O-antigen ligase